MERSSVSVRVSGPSSRSLPPGCYHWGFVCAIFGLMVPSFDLSGSAS